MICAPFRAASRTRRSARATLAAVSSVAWSWMMPMVKGELVASTVYSLRSKARPLPCRCAWAYHFPSVFRFFAGFVRDHAGSVRLRVRVYVLRQTTRDLVNGITRQEPRHHQARRPVGFGGPFPFYGYWSTAFEH